MSHLPVRPAGLGWYVGHGGGEGGDRGRETGGQKGALATTTRKSWAVEAQPRRPRRFAMGGTESAKMRPPRRAEHRAQDKGLDIKPQSDVLHIQTLTGKMGGTGIH